VSSKPGIAARSCAEQALQPHRSLLRLNTLRLAQQDKPMETITL